jgi:chemotaxis protein MotB
VSRRTKNKRHVSHERWLISYADFITLLFAFFVVMFASSQADSKKAAQVAASIQGAFQELGVFTGAGSPPVADPRTPTVQPQPAINVDSRQLLSIAETAYRERAALAFGGDVNALKSELEKALGDEIQRHEVQMRVTPEGLVVSMREIGFFNSGEAELLPGGQAALTRIAGVLGERGFEIRVEGHTDNVPIHNPRFKSNWELSTARSTAVVSLLIERYNFDPLLASAAGYSEYRPVASNDSAQGRAVNRRVDLIVVGRVPSKDKTGQANGIVGGTE